MKVLIIDVSYNSNLNQVLHFLHKHDNADFVYLYDFEYALYDSVTEAEAELTDHSDDYFIYPCAHRDIVTKLLGKIRFTGKYCDVFVCSDYTDNCSVYSDEDSFDNYIYHIENTTNLILHGFDSNNDYEPSIISEFTESFIARLFNKLLSYISQSNSMPEEEYYY